MHGQSQVQLSRGSQVTPSELTGITATTTSNVQSSRGHNAIIIYHNFTAGSGTFTTKIQGKSPDGVFVDIYDQNGNQMAFTSTADAAQFLVGLPFEFKLVSTEDADGATVTVSYELFTV